VVTDSHTVLHFIKQVILSHCRKDCNLCVFWNVDSPYPKVPWCLWTILWRPQIPHWERNQNFRVSLKKGVRLLNCNFYVPDQFLSGSHFLHWTHERSAFSHPCTMGSGKRL